MDMSVLTCTWHVSDDGKSKLVQLVYLNHQNMCTDSHNWMMPLAGSGLKTEGDRLNIKIVAALFVIMPAHYFYVEICDLKKNILKMHPTRVPTLKKLKLNQKYQINLKFKLKLVNGLW